jgi:aspartyl-tRNA(Asn)/glutamyl-tRNA(Gln) amidotransferase subunit A
VAEGVKSVLDELAARGARIVPIDLPELDEAYAIFRKGGLAAAELSEFLAAELPEWFDTLDPNVRARTVDGQSLSAVDYLNRVRIFSRAGASANERLREVDVLATPTVAITPPKLTEVADPEAYRRNNMLTLRNTSIGNLLDLCALTLPVALDRASMPVGLQLIACRGTDARLVATGLAVEAVLGNARQRIGMPPLEQER